MKVLMVGINAKYIHSNLAIRSLHKYAATFGFSVLVEEYTINQSVDYVLREIVKLAPDLIGFSCYIWNIEMIKKLTRALKQISPQTRILLGGPEVSYDGENLLKEEPSIDFVCYGEGEETFKNILEALHKDTSFESIDGLIFRNPQIVKNQSRAPLSMDALPFVYHNSLCDFEHRILYYETIRGCPFNCQYCLSSIEKGVRFRSISLVKRELQFFLDQKVKQVKFVDRTFNCSKKHAMAIWTYLAEQDNGVTNFHFEISADLLDLEMLIFLKTVRIGLFQFEIGVQSTSDKTLESIQRKTNFEALVNNVMSLKAGDNIHLHLDLIAGLPHEDYQTFKKSFNDVYALRPEQLQLGFLKVLKGSGLLEDCEAYGIKYRTYAPYEVLCTKDLTFLELEKLKTIEEMVEFYYNSGQYEWTMLYLERQFETPFDLYEALATEWELKGHHKVSHSRGDLMVFLKEFSELIKGAKVDLVRELILFDLCLLEKIKKYPPWMDGQEAGRNESNGFYKDPKNIAQYLPQLTLYSPKQISRMAHIEGFLYDLTRFVTTKGEVIDKKSVWLLFNYHNRDQMRHKAQVFEVQMDPIISAEISLFPRK
ncbi:MAG: B12-binding domain-containing radical SAM protein [Vallitaleaceae bacterium]|nr:B12-binding domain-containing radical SAM protein [Vallitaleaceae bacterium]